MTTIQPEITVIKMNLLGEETWRYQGFILEKNEKSLLIEAFFNREDLLFNGITLKENDRFLERYYQDRWYNIFEIHDRDDDCIKGWYCNVTRPAVFHSDSIAYVDLALDLLVYPDGKYLILDEDEFENLPLDSETQTRAHQALEELIFLVENDHLTQLMKFPPPQD